MSNSNLTVALEHSEDKCNNNFSRFSAQLCRPVISMYVAVISVEYLFLIRMWMEISNNVVRSYDYKTYTEIAYDLTASFYFSLRAMTFYQQ